MAEFDPGRDLVIEREMSARPPAIWDCLIDPVLVARWCAPGGTESAEIEPRLGGRAAITVEGLSEGPLHLDGCILLAERHWRLVWTSALRRGWRPAPADVPRATAELTLALNGPGTRLRVHLRHATPEGLATSRAMGTVSALETALSRLDTLSHDREPTAE